MPPTFVPFGGDRKSVTAGGFDIPGSFGTNGLLAPLNVRGKGFTVERTGIGEFTVTLTYRIGFVDQVQATAQCAVAGDFQVEVGEVLLTSRTIMLRTLQGGVPFDPAADANNRVNFSIAVGGP